jgi:hypothetical protein
MYQPIEYYSGDYPYIRVRALVEFAPGLGRPKSKFAGYVIYEYNECVISCYLAHHYLCQIGTEEYLLNPVLWEQLLSLFCLRAPILMLLYSVPKSHDLKSPLHNGVFIKPYKVKNWITLIFLKELQNWAFSLLTMSTSFLKIKPLNAPT